MTKIKSSFFNTIIREDDSKVDDIDDKEVVDTDNDHVEDPLDDPNSEVNKMKYADDEDDLDKDSEDKDKEDDEDDTEFFTTIINEKAEQGILFYDEDKEYEGTGEEIFDQVLEDTVAKRWKDEYLDTIPEEYHSIFKHLKAGKPLDEWVEAVKPLDFDSINLEDEGNQKQLIEDHLALTGMDEEDIKDTIKEYEEGDLLEKKSKIALKYLKANEAKKVELYEKELEKEIKEQKRQEAEDLKELQTEILTKDELEGFKLDKKTREKLFDHITKPINKRGESQLVINQKSRDKQLLVAYLDMINFKFDDIKKGVETKVTSGLRAKLSGTTDINAKRGGATGKVIKDSVKLPKGSWDAPRDLDE